MKNKGLFFVLLATVISSMFLISAAKPDERKDTVTVEGYVHCMGNEPFIYPGIKTIDGKEYFVIASDEIKLDLLKNQGKKLYFTGYILKKGMEYPAMKDGSFEIIKFKEILK